MPFAPPWMETLRTSLSRHPPAVPPVSSPADLPSLPELSPASRHSLTRHPLPSFPDLSHAAHSSLTRYPSLSPPVPRRPCASVGGRSRPAETAAGSDRTSVSDIRAVINAGAIDHPRRVRAGYRTRWSAGGTGAGGEMAEVSKLQTAPAHSVRSVTVTPAARRSLPRAEGSMQNSRPE